ARSRRRADLSLQRHPPLRRQPLGESALDTAHLLQPGRQRHVRQERRPLLRAARRGRRRRAAPRRSALCPWRQRRALRVATLRTGPAQGIIDGVSLDVRKAETIDLQAIVELVERTRRQLQKYQRTFWRKAANSAAATEDFFARLLTE